MIRHEELILGDQLMLRWTACIIALTVSSTSLAQSSTPAGFVLSMNGQWQAEQEILKPGEVVFGGVFIKPGDASDTTAHITIALFTGKTIQRSCRLSGGCSAVLEVPDPTTHETALTARLIEAVQKLFTRQQWPDAHTYTRSSLELDNQLLAVEDRSLDTRELTGSAFKIPLEFEDLQTSEVSTSMSLERPGLYGVSAEDNRDAIAWVLVCRQDVYAEADRDFEALSRLVRGWRNVPENDIHGVLRSYLFAVAGDCGVNVDSPND